MAEKKSLEEVFENFDPDVSKFMNLNQDEDSQNIFDDIVIVDERYNQSSMINQGGMKKIFKTSDSLTNRPVAKATLIDWSDSWKVESFLREARLTAALEHPNIMPIYDIGVDEEEGPYFIMKLVGGENLDDILKKLSKPEHENEYTLNKLLEIFLKICDAVAFAHSKGIVHLDLKPANIQVDNYGEVLVCDWGLAKVLENAEEISDFDVDLDPGIYNDVTLDGIIKGTPGYMAPEQINTELGPKNKQTDIYALGGILYSLLCFKKPYESETLEALMKETLHGKLILPSERRKLGNVPSSLEAVAIKALEVNSEDRYQSVNELREEINKWMEGFATEAENASFIKSLWLLLNRHKIVSLLLFLLVFSVALAFYFVKENEQIAIYNEQQAKQALEELQKQKEFAELVSVNSVLQLKTNYNNHLEKKEFREALELINKTVELYPSNPLLNSFKGEVHFYLHEFGEAEKAFEKSGSSRHQEPLSAMIPLVSKYAFMQKSGKTLSAQDLIDIVNSLSGVYRDNFRNYMENRILKDYQTMFNDPNLKPLIDRHLEYCRLMFIEKFILMFPKYAKKQEIDSKYKFKYTLDEQGIHMDFSKSPLVDEKMFIEHLPLVSLNLENTSFWRRWVFNHPTLKSVNIRNTKIKMLKRENYANKLREIILTQEQFDASDKVPASTKKKRLSLIVR